MNSSVLIWDVQLIAHYRIFFLKLFSIKESCQEFSPLAELELMSISLKRSYSNEIKQGKSAWSET